MSRSFLALSRPLVTWACLLTLVVVSPSAEAGRDDTELLAVVPSTAAVVVSTDHATLSKHPHYLDVLKFLVSQGWGAGLEALSSSGLKLGKDVGSTVSYRTSHGAEGLVLKLASTEKLRASAASKRGSAFESSEEGGYPSFTLTKRLRAYELGGGVLLIAPSAIGKRALESLGKKKVMSKKRGFSKLAKRARGLGDSLWGVAYVPGALRKRMKKQGTGDMAGVERVLFGAKGLGPTLLRVEATAKSPAEAEGALAALRSKIDRKILSSTVLKALGAGILVDLLELSTSGKRLDASMSLTAPQVGLLSRLAKRLVRSL